MSLELGGQRLRLGSGMHLEEGPNTGIVESGLSGSGGCMVAYMHCTALCPRYNASDRLGKDCVYCLITYGCLCIGMLCCFVEDLLYCGAELRDVIQLGTVMEGMIACHPAVKNILPTELCDLGIENGAIDPLLFSHAHP